MVWQEVPLFARIIHLADVIDAIANNIKCRQEKWDKCCEFLVKQKGLLFDDECVEAFFEMISKETFVSLEDGSFESKLWEIVPRKKQMFDWNTCKNIADFFANIVDYKSPFTSRHSIGVAEKAAQFAKYIGYDVLDIEKMYLAGALHDIGKMAVGNEILEKPDKLTDEEFDKMKKEYDLKGTIRSNSNIMREMMITSDNAFFNKIGLEETKRYFKESYKFVCNYQNLGEKYIVSAAVHLDETTPHMHLVYIPVIHTKDKEGNKIDKICCRDFWKGRDSYRQLQNAFHKYITSKGFDLERGLPVEETGAKHEKIEDLKKLTNFENTKKVLDNIKLKLPETPNINDIKLIKLNKEKVENEIIKPKDDKIMELYQENLKLHNELSKQVNLFNKSENYQKERDAILADNKELVKNFEEETHSFIDSVEQIKYAEKLEK